MNKLILNLEYEYDIRVDMILFQYFKLFCVDQISTVIQGWLYERCQYILALRHVELNPNTKDKLCVVSGSFNDSNSELSQHSVFTLGLEGQGFRIVGFTEPFLVLVGDFRCQDASNE